jgi:hypothetical protein
VKKPAEPRRSQREHQRERTRVALVDSARTLIQSGLEVTMPGIARAAGVSEADLLSILQEGFIGVWPSADELMPNQQACPDPVERVAIAAEMLGRNVLRVEGAVRTMIALTIARRDAVGARPAHRVGLIDSALAPLAGHEGERLAQLRNDLAIVISAEALFTLLDLKKLPPDAAVASMTKTAKSLVYIALRDLGN